jgi:hypothetical protein
MESLYSEPVEVPRRPRTHGQLQPSSLITSAKRPPRLSLLIQTLVSIARGHELAFIIFFLFLRKQSFNSRQGMWLLPIFYQP